MDDGAPLRFLRDQELYESVVEERILGAEKSVDIATANVKEIRVRRRGKFVSIVRIFEEMIGRGVSIRILHGAPPSRRFHEEVEASAELARCDRFEMMYCPRSHWKAVIADGRFVYAGSANLTGAGLGVKKAERRNFETGFVSSDPTIVAWHAAVFDRIWSTSLCEACERREFCE